MKLLNSIELHEFITELMMDEVINHNTHGDFCFKNEENEVKYGVRLGDLNENN
jgi:hypothetical protein